MGGGGFAPLLHFLFAGASLVRPLHISSPSWSPPSAVPRESLPRESHRQRETRGTIERVGLTRLGEVAGWRGGGLAGLHHLAIIHVGEEKYGGVVLSKINGDFRGEKIKQSCRYLR